MGIFIPLLPTTPFVLLAAACFFRSSSPLYGWLIRHKLFGYYIRNYLAYRAVTLKSKIFSIAVLWIFILTSAIYFVNAPWLKLTLLIVAAGVTIHLIKLKTLTKEMIDNSD